MDELHNYNFLFNNTLHRHVYCSFVVPIGVDIGLRSSVSSWTLLIYFPFFLIATSPLRTTWDVSLLTLLIDIIKPLA